MHFVTIACRAIPRMLLFRPAYLVEVSLTTVLAATLLTVINAQSDTSRMWALARLVQITSPIVLNVVLV